MKWIKCKERLPEEVGRYLVLETFYRPVRCNDDLMAENIPFVSNYRPERGWLSKTNHAEITHWMEIPELTDELD